MKRAQVKEIRKDLSEALKSVALKHGVKFEIGTINYDSKSLRATLEGFDVEDVSDKDSIDRGKFEAVIGRHGYKFEVALSDFNREFTLNGEIYKLKGINPKATKFPFICENSNGRRLLFQKSITKHWV